MNNDPLFLEKIKANFDPQKKTYTIPVEYLKSIQTRTYSQYVLPDLGEEIANKRGRTLKEIHDKHLDYGYANHFSEKYKKQVEDYIANHTLEEIKSAVETYDAQKMTPEKLIALYGPERQYPEFVTQQPESEQFSEQSPALFAENMIPMDVESETRGRTRSRENSPERDSGMFRSRENSPAFIRSRESSPQRVEDESSKSSESHSKQLTDVLKLSQSEDVESESRGRKRSRSRENSPERDSGLFRSRENSPVFRSRESSPAFRSRESSPQRESQDKDSKRTKPCISAFDKEKSTAPSLNQEKTTASSPATPSANIPTKRKT